MINISIDTNVQLSGNFYRVTNSRAGAVLLAALDYDGFTTVDIKWYRLSSLVRRRRVGRYVTCSLRKGRDN